MHGWFSNAFFLLSDMPASGMYFLTYEYLQRLMAKDGEKLGLVSTILAGGCAGIANWIVGMPPDVLKSRLQTGKINYSIRAPNISKKSIFYQTSFSRLLKK